MGYFGSNYFGSDYWAAYYWRPTPQPVPPIPPVIIGGGHGRAWRRPLLPVWPHRLRWPQWLLDLMAERQAQREGVAQAVIAQDNEDLMRLL